MVTRVFSRDYERLSAYLDGQLTGKDLQRLETRLAQDAQLRDELIELKRMRAMLRSLPRQRAPRNFTLTPAMVGVKPRPTARLYPVMGFASALASLLFVLMVLGDFLGFIPSFMPRSSDPALVQEAAPLALVLTEESLPAPEAQLKSAAPPEEAAELSAGSSLTDEANLLAPTEEEAALAFQMPSMKEIAPTETVDPVLTEGEEAMSGLAVGGGLGEETLPVSPETLTPTPTAEPYDVLMRIEASTLITPTATPTPMPTETPLPTVVTVLLPTVTSTPTPMPTETPLAVLKAVVEEQPTATPTAEVLAFAVQEATADPAAELELDAAAETGPSLVEREASPTETSLRPVLIIQVGLLILAVITGAAFLVLRYKES